MQPAPIADGRVREPSPRHVNVAYAGRLITDKRGSPGAPFSVADRRVSSEIGHRRVRHHTHNRADARSGRQRVANLAALTVILAIGMAVRAYYLSLPIKYYEAFTFLEYGRDSLRSSMSNYLSTYNHLLNPFLVHLSTTCLGNQDWGLRLPDFLFALLKARQLAERPKAPQTISRRLSVRTAADCCSCARSNRWRCVTFIISGSEKSGGEILGSGERIVAADDLNFREALIRLYAGRWF